MRNMFLTLYLKLNLKFLFSPFLFHCLFYLVLPLGFLDFCSYILFSVRRIENNRKNAKENVDYHFKSEYIFKTDKEVNSGW